MKSPCVFFISIFIGINSFCQINEDWENDDWIESWEIIGENWEVGTPTSGPNTAFNSSRCVATNLAGDYSQPFVTNGMVDNMLISPYFQVPDATQNPYLRYWQWYSIHSGDYGEVQIRTEGREWERIEGPFTWSSSNSWSSPLIDLSAYAGSRVQIAFNLHIHNTTASTDASSGWYIDDIEIVTGDIVFNEEEDFENGIGHWSALGAWALGVPTSGPNASHSNSNCFATNLAGDYNQPFVTNGMVDNMLISPYFQVSDTVHNPRIRFWHWYNFSEGDYGEVFFRIKGEEWTAILGPFTGTSEGEWRRPFFDLSPYIGKMVQVAYSIHIKNTTASSDASSGWYIDDFVSQDFLTLPPPEIRISKSGTTPVPGRSSDYFILVENVGDAIETDLEVGELLNPYHLILERAEPPIDAPDSTLQKAFFVHWTIPEIIPGEIITLEYTVKVRDTVALGTIISGGVCKGKELLTKLGNCFLDLASNIPGCTLCGVECRAAATPICLTVCRIPTIPTIATCIACFSPCIDCMLFDFQGGGQGGCARDVIGSLWDCYKDLLDCDEDKQETQGPVDPNEKEVIANKYILPNQTLVYPIHFENIGTIEAIDVFVTDTLSTNLDLSTLEILTPEGALIDVDNRIVRWELLDRNLLPGETDNVLLAIKPLPDLPSGTEIRNDAAIQFEIFEPIITDEVINIIDGLPPTSYVNPLPPVSFQVDVPVSWTGIDSIGEIDNYTIFLSIDGSNYTEYLQKTQETSMIFTGELGKTYRFISIAEDVAGNIEAKEIMAEAITYIDPSVSVNSNPKEEREERKALLQNYPNPFAGETTIEYQVYRSGRVLLEVFDLFGNKVRTLVDQNQAQGNYKITWDGLNQGGARTGGGIYFYRLLANEQLDVKKMIIAK